MSDTLIFDLLARDKSVTDTFQRAGRSAEDAAGKMNSAFGGASKSISAELDKIERAAWESGKGMDAAFSSALTVVRDDLSRINDVARSTGQGLESDLGSALLDVRRSMEQLRPAADEMGDAAKQAASKMDSSFKSAAEKIERELDDIKQAAWESGRGMDREFTRAMQGLRENLDRINSEASHTGAKLESELGGALRDVREQASKLKKELDDTDVGGGFGESLSSSLSGGFDVGGIIDGLVGTGGGGGMWAAAGAAIGGTIAAAEWEAFQSAFEQQKIGGLISAQQGGTVAEGRKLGSIAGDAYYDGFAASVEDAGAALSGVLGQGLVDTSDSRAEIQDLTNTAATAAQVVGDDANAVARAAKQLIVNDLAPNAKDALDLVTFASQSGANAAGDLLDTLEEYPVQFQRLGLSGQEALGLIDQAMDAGARNADIAADALKEFAIRAQDGSASTSRGFKAIGLDAQGMGENIAAGGARAHEALGLTLDRLRAIEDPVKRNQVAVDLFGTKAEDLGDALYAMDLDGAAERMDGFAGATQHAADVIKENTPPLERFGKSVEQAANIAIGLASGMNSAGEATEENTGKIKKSSGATDALKTDSEKLAEAQQGVRDATASAVAQQDSYVQTLEQTIAAQEALADQYSSAARANIGYFEAVDAANQALAENGVNIDATTEKGRANQEALLDLSDATWANVRSMEQQGYTATDVQGFMTNARQAFIDHATAMGYSADEANALADKLHLIPGDYTARVHADTRAARADLAGFQGLLNTIFGRTYTIAANAIAQVAGVVAGHRAGGGDVEEGRGYFVGEEGMEFFVPKQDGMIIPNDVLRASAGRLQVQSYAAYESTGMGGYAGAGGVSVTFGGDVDGAFASAFMKLVRTGAIRIAA